MFCRKALSNLFLRVYTGMMVSKNIRVPAASRFLRLPPHHVFGKNHHIVCRFTLSICGLLLHNFNAVLNSIAIVLIIIQKICHQCIRSVFPCLRINSILRHGKDSRSEFVVTDSYICRPNMGYILRLKDMRISSLNFLKICLQNGPCIHAQRFVFDQIIVLLNCRFQCSLYCFFVCSELLPPLGQQPVSAVSVNAPPKSKTARLEIFLTIKHILSDSILYSRGLPPFLVYCNISPPGQSAFT